MRQIIAFTKKEFLEQFRTGKLILLTILFCLFGIMNPAIAKLTPWLLELMSDQLTESGMTVGIVQVNALTSWTQFFKNMPIMLIIFIIIFSGILTTEYQKGTLINIVTKGMERWKIIISKASMMTMLWTLGCLISYGITYVYNAYFWDNSVVGNVFFASFCFYLFGLWLISVVCLSSSILRSASAVTLVTGGAFLISYLLGMIPKMEEYLPSHLMNAAELLMRESSVGNYAMAMTVALIFILLNIVLTVVLFNKRNI